ncbi:MAG: hypothetical protein ACOVOC_16935, partial [Rhabdaerophilum sp.]
FVLIKVVLPSFLAREEMGRPVLAALLALAVNGISAWLLRSVDPVLAAPGGVVAGVWANTLLLLVMARGRLAFQPRAGWRVAATLFGALAMGWCVHALLPYAAPLLEPGRGFGLRIAVLTGLCLTGIVIFGVLTRVLGVYSLAAIRRQAGSL